MKNDNVKLKIYKYIPPVSPKRKRGERSGIPKFYILRFAFLFFFAVGYLLFAALPTYAALVPNCRGAGCTPCNLLELISNITMFIVRDITAPLAGLLFLIGGIMMVSAGGDESRYKKGKDIFKNTVFGVVIVLASWVLVNTLITTFGSNVEGFVPSSWWQVNCR